MGPEKVTDRFFKTSGRDERRDEVRAEVKIVFAPAAVPTKTNLVSGNSAQPKERRRRQQRRRRRRRRRRPEVDSPRPPASVLVAEPGFEPTSEPLQPTGHARPPGLSPAAVEIPLAEDVLQQQLDPQRPRVVALPLVRLRRRRLFRQIAALVEPHQAELLRLGHPHVGLRILGQGLALASWLERRWTETSRTCPCMLC